MRLQESAVLDEMLSALMRGLLGKALVDKVTSSRNCLSLQYGGYLVKARLLINLPQGRSDSSCIVYPLEKRDMGLLLNSPKLV